jgi:hypothetical protein
MGADSNTDRAVSPLSLRGSWQHVGQQALTHARVVARKGGGSPRWSVRRGAGPVEIEVRYEALNWASQQFASNYVRLGEVLLDVQRACTVAARRWGRGAAPGGRDVPSGRPPRAGARPGANSASGWASVTGGLGAGTHSIEVAPPHTGDPEALRRAAHRLERCAGDVDEVVRSLRHRRPSPGRRAMARPCRGRLRSASR